MAGLFSLFENSFNFAEDEIYHQHVQAKILCQGQHESIPTPSQDASIRRAATSHVRALQHPRLPLLFPPLCTLPSDESFLSPKRPLKSGRAPTFVAHAIARKTKNRDANALCTRIVCVCVCVCVCVKWQPTRRAVDISARRSRPFDSCHLWPLSAIFPSSSMRTLGYRSLITSRFNFKHSLLLFSLLFFSFNDLDATFVVHSIAFCAERYKRSCIKDRNDSIR